MSGRPEKVVVAVSGGVDSSFAASILSREYDAIAVHFTKFSLSILTEEVRERDRLNLESARAAAERLGVRFHVVEAGERFEPLVDFFCSEYNAGRTPNPCVLCNATIKWPVLLAAADEEGARFVATGHYARVEPEGALCRLLKGRDAKKDQTYFLHRLTQEQLSRTLFPLGEMTKEEVKAGAAQLGLKTVWRKESQEICFMPERGYREILKAKTPEEIRGGRVVDESGQVLGKHEGYQYFTTGQRRGLQIALGEPAYVVDIDSETAEVTLGDAEALERRTLAASDVNWVSGAPPAQAFEATVKIRYSHKGASGKVVAEGGGARVYLAESVRAVTEGQAAVFYIGEEVVGGGPIGEGSNLLDS